MPVPLLLRLPVAAIVITWAALGDRRWALPIGVLLAMPVIWWGSFALLTACVALRRDDIDGGCSAPAARRWATRTGAGDAELTRAGAWRTIPMPGSSTVTFLFSDIEGSTRLEQAGRHGPYARAP